MPEEPTNLAAGRHAEEADARRGEAPALCPALTGRAFDCLLAAGPWMSFLGVVSFVVCGFLLIAGVVIMLTGNRLYSIPGGATVGLIYIASSVLCFFPARFIFLAGSKLRSVRAGGGADTLEAALQNSKAYWKFSGILTIVSLGLAVLLVIIAIFVFAFS
jgi:hypothetical protein